MKWLMIHRQTRMCNALPRTEHSKFLVDPGHDYRYAELRARKLKEIK